MKLNCILWCQCPPCNCSSNWCTSEQRVDTCNIMILRSIFLLPSSPKMIKGLQVCWVQIHLFLSWSYHGASWECQKKKSCYVASCKFLMLLHRGSADSLKAVCPAEWGTVYSGLFLNEVLIFVVFLMLIGPSTLMCPDISVTTMSSCLSQWFALFN